MKILFVLFVKRWRFAKVGKFVNISSIYLALGLPATPFKIELRVSNYTFIIY